MLHALLTAIDIAAFAVVTAAVVRKHTTKANPARVLFIDCDDCLYQNEWRTAEKITASIAAYTAKLGVSRDEAYALYKKHGTCLKGLLLEGKIGQDGVEPFLHEVHSIDYSDIKPDPELRRELERLSVPRWIFTASTVEHVQRCLGRLGLANLPWLGVIDTRTCKLETKHAQSSFEAAMRHAAAPNPAACILCDDSVKNIVAAKAVGWRTVLIGLNDRDTGKPIKCDAADFHLPSLHSLRTVLPECFD
jgi:pyrimidine 5'-nucleotidase